MRRTIATTWMAAGALLLLGFSAAPARAQSQASSDSLGDYARSIRKNKPDAGTSSHHYDNDNLPRTGTLSVVGPEASSDAAKDAKPADSSTDRQRANDELQKKIDDQKKKLDTLSKDLDLEQREYRLRVAQYYTDPNNRLQNSLKWDDENKKHQADEENKQKAIDSARSQLDDLQKQAKEAGLEQKDSSDKDKSDKDTSDKNNSKDTSKSDDSDNK